MTLRAISRKLERALQTVSEQRQRDQQACCMDCGRKYGDEYGFPDLVVPNDVWAQISPTGHEGGLLCPSCLCHRAFDAGIDNVAAVFRSGPFCVDAGSPEHDCSGCGDAP